MCVISYAVADVGLLDGEGFCYSITLLKPRLLCVKPCPGFSPENLRGGKSCSSISQIYEYFMKFVLFSTGKLALVVVIWSERWLIVTKTDQCRENPACPFSIVLERKL